MAPLLPVLLLFQSAASPPPPAAPVCDHVVMVSADGLRSDALLALPPEQLPGFARLRRGAGTLNARTDPDWTVTLPNHTSMLTGRFVEGDDGHGWRFNAVAPAERTLHVERGAYVAGCFDVAHDHGLSTGLYTGKPKFAVYDHSWDAASGAPDSEGADDGRDKLDRWVFEQDMAVLTGRCLAELPRERRTLTLLHLAAPDLAAHKHGWDLTRDSPYMRDVQAVDAQVARLLDAIEADPALRGRTVVLLTADHGGSAPFRSHDQAHMWVNYIVPFLTWTGGGEPLDLYALNADTRRDPGLGQPGRDDPGLPPVRNGDLANLALSLLGLPAVPHAQINARLDLRLTPAAKRSGVHAGG